jgi:Mg2+/Co2+ transporter CorB
LKQIGEILAEHWLTILAILGLIGVSGFFSGSETALTAASRARMHSLKPAAMTRAGTVNTLIERKDRLIGALLIGNNLVNILASALATSVLLSMFGDSGVALATLIDDAVAGGVRGSPAQELGDLDTGPVRDVRGSGGQGMFVLIVGPLSSLINWIVRKIMSLFGVTFARKPRCCQRMRRSAARSICCTAKARWSRPTGPARRRA